MGIVYLRTFSAVESRLLLGFDIKESCPVIGGDAFEHGVERLASLFVFHAFLSALRTEAWERSLSLWIRMARTLRSVKIKKNLFTSAFTANDQIDFPMAEALPRIHFVGTISDALTSRGG